MKKIKLIVWGLCAALGVQAQSAKITSDKDLDWAAHKSFDITKGDLVTVTKQELNKEAILEEVRKTIIDEMEDKGYVYTPGEGELVVTFTAEIVETIESGDVGPLGQQPADEPINIDQSRTWSQERREGSLAIDISTKQNHKSVWRSAITVGYAADQLIVALNAAAGKSLRKLPEIDK